MKLHQTYHAEIFKTATALNRAGAEFIITRAKEAIAEKGRFVMALSGGQTPKNIYALLADAAYRERIEWRKVFIFWGDERCVPLDDEQNNAYEATSILLSKVDIPLSNIHAIPVNLSPQEAARKYEQTIRDFFEDQPLQFDLVLLGLGKNGHTASLFPDTEVLTEKAAGIRAVYVAEENRYRVTMTAALINQARCIVFLVAGAEKSAITAQILSASGNGMDYPAQLIRQEDGELYWLMDRAAAALIHD